MQTRQRFSEEITATALSWPGVSAGMGSRGEWAFKVGARELGHLHGDHAAHFAFPKDLWRRLLAEGRVTEHPIFPGQPGWAARGIGDADDVAAVLALLRLNYDRAVSRRPERAGGAPATPTRGDSS